MTTGSLQTAGVGLIATLLLMAGCAQPPAEQLTAAQKTVDAAKAVKENGAAVSREIQRAIDQVKEMKRGSHG